MTYPESIEFLYNLRWFGLKLGLENTRHLAGQAGNPQERLRFIHIAGTNGKGSVAAMLEGIYRAAGLRVGLYTSPHLVSFRERIQVNRVHIGETEVVRLVEDLRQLSGTDVASIPQSAIRNAQSPTFFEFVTVMALKHFAAEKCDLVIWETGLGGRLDATNIVTPLASVITNVEPDHQRWLGHDLNSIAKEKAGIIKPGRPVITAASEPEALAVIQETALSRSSPLTLVTPPHTAHPPLDQIQLPLLGWHQRMNAAVALATVRVLQAELPVNDSAVRSGLADVRWAGRLQLIERRGPPAAKTSQRILLDGAHNASGATSLRAVLEEDFAGTRPTLILGILQDKDWKLMCEVLAPVADRILCVPVKSERGATPDQLAQACRLTNRTAGVKVIGSLSAALDEAADAPFVVVAGSLYLVGEALDLLNPGARPRKNEVRLNEWTDARRRV